MVTTTSSMPRTAASKTAQFRLLDGRVFHVSIYNPETTVSRVAARVAARAGIAGAVESISPESGEVLSPDTRFDDLPDQHEVALVPELTPAAR